MTDKSWLLQRKLLRAPGTGFNTEVMKWFKDAETVTTRKALRDSLLIQAKESRTSALFKIQYFREFVQQTHLKPAIYGIPTTTYHEDTKFHPQVELFFAQDKMAVPEGKTAIQATINFRLMGTTPTTITKAEVNTLAANIKRAFVVADEGYVFTKGKHIVSYADAALGYYLQIYATSKAEGEAVIKKVLDIQNHTYDSEKMSFHSPEKDSINNPSGTIKILGEDEDKTRYRPSANVKFRYAFLKLNGLTRDKVLVDTTGHFREALVKA